MARVLQIGDPRRMPHPERTRPAAPVRVVSRPGDAEALAYEKAIEKLIPLAERAAYDQVGMFGEGEGSDPADERAKYEWSMRWNDAFHTEMDRLARARGLR